MNNKILDDTILKLYDYNGMSKEIEKIIGAINFMSFKYDNFNPPKITSNYEIKYNDFIPVKSSKVENFVIKKIILQENINEFMSKIVTAYRKLNEQEKIVFAEHFIHNNIEDNICMKVGACRDIIIKIKKSSAIKFLSSLGLDNKYIKC